MRRFSQFKAFKIINGYRKSTDEKHCGNCDYFIVKQMGNRYFKCALMGETASAASDIRKFNVCSQWQARRNRQAVQRHTKRA